MRATWETSSHFIQEPTRRPNLAGNFPLSNVVIIRNFCFSYRGFHSVTVSVTDVDVTNVMHVLYILFTLFLKLLNQHDKHY